MAIEKVNLTRKAKMNGNKYAIALSASANKGKTSILKVLVNGFRRDQSVVLVDMAPMKTGNDEMWCFEQDGVKIGIGTGGDNDEMVRKAFEFFQKNNCQIVFCATRYYANSPSWTEFVNQCTKGGYVYDWEGVDGYSPVTLSIMHRDIAENVLRKML